MKIGWIRTFTGIHFNVQDPDPAMVRIEDIAHHLSLECRWGGACSRHYSVAEHSIWVARFAKKMVPEQQQDLACIHGLLHDAHEAYLKDIPTPLKALWPGYPEAAAKIDNVILAALGLHLPTEGIMAAVHQADSYAAWAESQALLTPCGKLKGGTQPPDGLRQELQMELELVRPVAVATVQLSFLSYFEYLRKRVS